MIYFLPIMFLSAAMSLGADVILKKSSLHNSYTLLFVSIVIYSINTICWWYIYRHAKFSSVAVVYSICTILLSILIGRFYFHETMEMKEWISTIVGIITVVLLTS